MQIASISIYVARSRQIARFSWIVFVRWAFVARLMNYDWHFKPHDVRAPKEVFIHHTQMRFSCSFCFLIRLSYSACPFRFSKKKLLQQRSHQTSDRPVIPNILMMPISKSMEKIEPYVVEWVADWLSRSKLSRGVDTFSSLNLTFNCL